MLAFIYSIWVLYLLLSIPFRVRDLDHFSAPVWPLMVLGGVIGVVMFFAMSMSLSGPHAFVGSTLTVGTIVCHLLSSKRDAVVVT